MQKEQLDSLRDAAEAATTGAWVADGGIVISQDGFGDGRVVARACAGPLMWAESEFIASANPDTIIALLDHIEGLESMLAESQANDRAAMGYLAQVRAIVGGYDFPDMVSRVEGIAGFKPWPAKHLKTGVEYRVIGEAIDATNATEGRSMVIYRGNGQTFVREASEFMDKFSAEGGA